MNDSYSHGTGCFEASQGWTMNTNKFMYMRTAGLESQEFWYEKGRCCTAKKSKIWQRVFLFRAQNTANKDTDLIQLSLSFIAQIA